jgi:hypothetical protein
VPYFGLRFIFSKMLKLEIDGWDSILSLYNKAGHLYG